MEYRIEYDDDFMLVYLKQKITDKTYAFESQYDDPIQQFPFVADIFRIEGVVSVDLERYTIIIEKGKMFKWKDIYSTAIGIISTHIAPEDIKMPHITAKGVTSAPPKKSLRLKRKKRIVKQHKKKITSR